MSGAAKNVDINTPFILNEFSKGWFISWKLKLYRQNMMKLLEIKSEETRQKGQYHTLKMFN